MPRFFSAASAAVAGSCLLLGALAATTWAADLSKYREFQLGSNLPVVAKLAGMSPHQATTIHARPAQIQSLEWRPQPLGASNKTEPAQQVTFSFYNGTMFRVAVDYDRYEIEGMTTQDFVDAISANYGTADTKPALANPGSGLYGDTEEVLAQWQDDKYRFDLLRSSYGSGFRLVGVLKSLETQAATATLEAARLDDKEAPQRDASRLATEDAANRAKLEKARLLNKPKFRP